MLPPGSCSPARRSASLSAGGGRLRVDPWALGAAVAVFAVFAAPVVLSGQATFAGYITLDDTSTFLGLTDRVMSHGRDISGLAPSTYQRVLDVNLAHGYPAGSFMPFGIGHVLVRQDVAWLFQPAIVFCAALLALCLYALAEPLVRSRPVRALAVFIAAQPALLFAYSLWSGIKELTAAALVALVCALVARRAFVAVAVAAAAILDVLGAAGVVWLIPAIVGLAFLSRRTPGRAVRCRGRAGACAARVADRRPVPPRRQPRAVHERRRARKPRSAAPLPPALRHLAGKDFRVDPDIAPSPTSWSGLPSPRRSSGSG